uniref:Uncharacterized protein n=1 Tax=uncultured prokaryote TaxID=198431 RepID=A0A0H5Q7F9_9ZZZZ|nr:hypothetical protein [uncultured prokaryote]
MVVTCRMESEIDRGRWQGHGPILQMAIPASFFLDEETACAQAAASRIRHDAQRRLEQELEQPLFD